METYQYKIENFLIPLLENIQSPSILEFGVQNGFSTIKFLELCNKNDGYLYSVDVDDCSKVSKDKRWTFIKSRDDNFDYVQNKIPNKFDIIYLDSLHEAEHVEKIFYEYYPMLNINGYFIIDDISHLPYLQNKDRNNFYCEINNKETFEKILEIYNANEKSFDLNYTLVSSGLAIIKKKENLKLNRSRKIKSRSFGLKNTIRRLWKRIKKN